MSNISKALRDFTHGLYVITTETNEGARGAVVSFVMQVSFDPKMVAVGLRKGTAIHDIVRDSRRFAINVLSVDQRGLAERIYSSGTEAVLPEEVHLHRTNSGLPILQEALSWVEAEVAEEAGMEADHTVFIGKVVDGEKLKEGKPASLRDVGLTYGG